MMFLATSATGKGTGNWHRKARQDQIRWRRGPSDAHAAFMKIALIDSGSYFHRAFHGTPEDPVAGMRAMILSALDALQPDRTIVALDHGRETFRNQIYPAYKANRPPSPEGYSDTKRVP